MEHITEEQFIAYYQEYAPNIFKYCYFRVHSKEDAEDLAAKVFTKTWDYLAHGNTIDRMRAFLYRSAHNAIVDFYKTSKKDQEVSIHTFGEDTIDIPDDTSFVKDAETKMLVQNIKQQLHELPDAYREIIILRYLDELSIEEIAKVTEMTENNVSVKLHRAVEKLKSIVAIHG